jgi:peptide deformylase
VQIKSAIRQFIDDTNAAIRDLPAIGLMAVSCGFMLALAIILMATSCIRVILH